eukprot:TRINITY_DN19661_c0_g1_i1.p1 TRINITY_DN19661_c0_g1~~TRINITY_DN19661_c0_g1_i1.p1  ORF type:complete len:353 (+),score=76.37 TRINITY_DN19661_c0_g1_i1:54-1112(+)
MESGFRPLNNAAMAHEFLGMSSFLAATERAAGFIAQGNGSAGEGASSCSDQNKNCRSSGSRWPSQWSEIGIASVSRAGLGVGVGLRAAHQLTKRVLPPNISGMLAATGAALIPALGSGGSWGAAHALGLASASIALGNALSGSPFYTEPKTGLEFPTQIPASETLEQLTGVGIRNKNLFGLKNIKVYAFGLYVDPDSVKAAHKDKYGDVTPASIKKEKDFFNDFCQSEAEITMRLIIYYKGLKIGKVRSAFEESLGKSIKKISGQENKVLLNSFTKLFVDDLQLHRGSVIDISRKSGGKLVTKLDGQLLGSVDSSLMCHAFFDLYLGDNPYDAHAKDTMAESLAKILASPSS